MPETHTTITGPHNEVTVIFHNPGQHPLPVSAAKPVTQSKDASGKVNAAHGQVSTGSTVQGPVFDSPA